MSVLFVIMILGVLTIMVGVLLALVVMRPPGAPAKRKRKAKRVPTERAPYRTRPARRAPAAESDLDEDEWIEYAMLEEDLDVDDDGDLADEADLF